jgi:hypothetical protein
MVPTRVAETVWREISCRWNVELGGQVDNDTGRHIRWIGQEGAEESGRDDLKRNIESVVIAAPIRQQLAIGVVQLKVASELGWHRLACIAAVALLRLVQEEVNGHGDPPNTGSSTDNCS